MRLEDIVSIGLGIFVTFIGGLLFTNAIEYIGHRARWTGSFTGAVIAPLFTSLPELIILLVALYIYGGVAGEKIGIGTILGQPFMASTIIFPTIFLAAIISYAIGRRNDLSLEVERVLVIPYIIFTALYPAVLLPLIPGFLYYGKYFVGALFLVVYLYYTYRMYRSKAMFIPEAEKPYIASVVGLGNPSSILALSAIQLIAAVTLLIYGSRTLVTGIDEASKTLNISPIALAILITPLAGVLPESITAIIWAFKGRDTLAVAAMVGEKCLYSTIYPAIGMLITAWELDHSAIVSVAIVEIISLLILYHISKGKLTLDVAVIGLLGYMAFSIYAL